MNAIVITPKYIHVTRNVDTANAKTRTYKSISQYSRNRAYRLTRQAVKATINRFGVTRYYIQ